MIQEEPNEAGWFVDVENVPAPEEEELICINRLQSDSSPRVKCRIQGLSLSAVVDTAAEVTIISERVYNRLNPLPPVIKQVRMQAAGENQHFTAQQVGPIDVGLGEEVFSRLVFVAPI